MALKTDTCPWQTLINTAFDRWIDHNSKIREAVDVGECSERQAHREMWEFADMLESCTESERIAVVLGKLNQQIENGGCMQWVENGYATDTRHILDTLMPSIGPVSKQIWDIIKSFLNDWTDESGLRIGSDEDTEESACEFCSEYVDEQFYSLQDQWHPEVYDYIANLK